MSTSSISGLSSSLLANYQSDPVAAAKQLATSQTISGELDVRLTLLGGLWGYASPLQQAWTVLGTSLANAQDDPGAMLYGAGTGDLGAAKTALDSYMQLLPSSSLYMSSLTAPSQAFLNDLQAMSNAINSGDLAGAQAAFGQALTNAPQDLASAMSQADFTGDAENQARLTMESAANVAGYLTYLGYTPENANIEANAFELGSITETPEGITVQNPSLDAQAERETDTLSKIASSSAPTSNQLAATAEQGMYKIYETLFASNPYAVRDSDLNANAERAVVLNQLFTSMGEADSAGSAALGECY